MPTVLVTGVTGFLGRYVAKEMREHGYRVYGVGTASEENAPVDLLDRYFRLRMPGKRLWRLFARTQPDLVVHCAGRASIAYSLQQPLQDYRGNTALCIHVLEAMRLGSPHARFVLISSAAVYGNPTTLPVREDSLAAPLSPYGFHKLQAELLCHEYWQMYGVPTTVLRVFSAFGPGLRRQLLWDLANKCARSTSVSLQGLGDESRDFIHARDVAAAIRCVAHSEQAIGQVYNVASGKETPIAEVAQMVAAHFPGVNYAFDGQVPPGVPSRWQACTRKLSALGFEIRHPLSDSIEEYIAWATPLIQA